MEDFLKRVQNYANSEQLAGLDSHNKKVDLTDPVVIKSVIKAASESKNIVAGLYYDFQKPAVSGLRRIKNIVIGKIANIVRNTIERSFLTQQKFNDQTYFLLETIYRKQVQIDDKLAQIQSQLADRK